MPAAKQKNPPHGPAKATRPKGVYGQGQKPAKATPAKATPKKKTHRKVDTRAGLYARVSTHDQQTLPMQVKAMRDHARRRGWRVELVVEDVGSGATERPRRQELLRAALRRDLDVVLVWRLDRWGRSLADLTATLGELVAAGVGFVSITEALDLTTPSGRALAGMLAVFAEFERDILRDRVRAGIAQARAAGKHLGRPPVVRSKHQAEVQRLAQNGTSKRRIAQQLGISRSSVRRLLEAGPDKPARR